MAERHRVGTDRRGVLSSGRLPDQAGSWRPAAKKALLSVPGIGYATTNYFHMLLGRPRVKPDRMVHRFLTRATGTKFSNAEADNLVTVVAAELGTDAHLLDHAIWRYESDHAAGLRATGDSGGRPHG